LNDLLVLELFYFGFYELLGLSVQSKSAKSCLLQQRKLNTNEGIEGAWNFSFAYKNNQLFHFYSLIYFEVVMFEELAQAYMWPKASHL
jgi:hypothetical protein